MRIVKLHIGVVKFLAKELPKRKNPKEVKECLKFIFGLYSKEMIKLFKEIPLIFDKTYQKSKKEYENRLKIQKELDRALKILRYFDDKMMKRGDNRHDIRQFWLSFTKEGTVREDVFNELYKDIHNIK